MEMAGKLTLRVLTMALLTVVGLVARPGVSLAWSTLQVVVQEGGYSDEFDTHPELRSTNVTASQLCQNVYVYNRDGSIRCCTSNLLDPFASRDTHEDGGLNEGSIFILSGRPSNGNCDATRPNPDLLGGLRSWLMIDDEAAVGISAQDANASFAVLQKLVSDCNGASYGCEDD